MERNLCLLALLCLFFKLPAQDTSFVKLALISDNGMLQQGNPALTVQRISDDLSNPYHSSNTLLSDTKERATSALYQSALLPYIEGLPTGYVVFPVKTEIGKRILATNSSLLSLFQLAYRDADIFYSNNRTMLKVSDTATFIASGSENSWCYESIVPKEQENTIFSVMQQDLQRYFPQYKARVEKRKIQCLALVRLSKKQINKPIKPIASSGGNHMLDFSAAGVTIKNGHLHELLERLNTVYLKDLQTPIIDETGITQKVDLELQSNMSDVASLRKSLNAYGLDLVNVKRKMKILVIRDSDPEDL